MLTGVWRLCPPEYRRSWRREVSGVNDCMNNVEKLGGSSFGNVPGSVSSRGGVGRPPELTNSDEQLLSEEGEEERGFIRRG